MATVINGKAIAAEIQSEIASRVTTLISKYGVTPCISVILVGDRKDSATYVRMKEQTAKQLLIDFQLHRLNEDVTEEELIAKVHEINNDSKVHGLLLQLPLPNHLDEHNITYQISPDKDVDGLHPHNIGKLALKGYTPKFISCTPKGCIELLKRSNIDVAGKNVVVLGRSNIVGIPISLLLLERDATVTICHSKSTDLPDKVRGADIVIAAVGKPQFVQGDWIKEGAIVIDVGINAVDDPSRASGYKLVGDVDYEAVKERASFITPVPGGVGPMTVAMLLENTVSSAESWVTENTLSHSNNTFSATMELGLILQVKKASEFAILPVRGTLGAAGYDLASAYDTVVPSKGKAIVKTDLIIKIPSGYYGRIAPRSSLAVKNFIDVGAGVIDEDYRGTVGVVLFNFSDEDFQVKRGDRIAQLILERIGIAEILEVDEIDETERGAGGFGSTGLN